MPVEDGDSPAVQAMPDWQTLLLPAKAAEFWTAVSAVATALAVWSACADTKDREGMNEINRRTRIH